jgi:hypothetical protein
MQASTPLVILNLALGLACLGCVVAVAVAAWLDIRERRCWRALVPDCWPPPGVDPGDAYAVDTPLRASSLHGSDS